MVNYFSYRIIFSKTKAAVYISHLDVMRTFTRAFRRSKTPIYYTEGFTKRPLLIFPYPLSLGIEGENEILDIKTYSEIGDVNDYIERLNDVLTDGIRVKGITSGEFPEINNAVYEIETPVNITQDEIKNFLSQDFIEATKYSKKKGTISFNLKPHIVAVDLLSDKIIKAILPVGEKSNVNVNVLIKAYADYKKMNSNEFYAKRIEFIP
jgi:radical SAM-linked protein